MILQEPGRDMEENNSIRFFVLPKFCPKRFMSVSTTVRVTVVQLNH